jgi:YesN/AraC family two-component response regulator
MDDSLRVMLVDDSKLALAQMRALVGEIDGAEVVAMASDGACAIRSAAHHRPHVILMDIVMPGMDGLSALRVIASTLPDIRVAMISSVGGSGNNAEEAFRLGAMQVIAKPVDPQQIESLVESEIELRRVETVA